MLTSGANETVHGGGVHIEHAEARVDLQVFGEVAADEIVAVAESGRVVVGRGKQQARVFDTARGEDIGPRLGPELGAIDRS